MLEGTQGSQNHKHPHKGHHLSQKGVKGEVQKNLNLSMLPSFTEHAQTEGHSDESQQVSAPVNPLREDANRNNLAQVQSEPEEADPEIKANIEALFSEIAEDGAEYLDKDQSLQLF